MKEPKVPLGRIVLNSYFCAKTEDSSNYEFTVNAYPKVGLRGALRAVVAVGRDLSAPASAAAVGR